MGLTLRQTMIHLLRQRELTALDLAGALLLTASEVEGHLPHLKQSLKTRLTVRPARCRGCGFVFKERRRLDAPGRCPRCRQEMVDGPWFRVVGP